MFLCCNCNMLSNDDNNNFYYYDQYNSICKLCNNCHKTIDNNLKQVDFDKLTLIKRRVQLLKLMRKNRK